MELAPPGAGRVTCGCTCGIDERSAAFLRARAGQGEPLPGGRACARRAPRRRTFTRRSIEADESAVPLLVLTADRPPELRGTGANQTIDQLKLYGSAVRWFCEVGVPEAACRAGRRTGGRAAGRAWGAGGGVGRRRAWPGAPEPGAARAARARRGLTRRQRQPRAAGGRGRGRSTDGRSRRAGPAGRAAGRRAVDQVRARPPSWPGPSAGWSSAATATTTPRPLLELAQAGGLAGAGRAVVGRPARAVRAVGLPVPAGRRRVRGGAPARRDRLGRAARPVPRAAGAAAGTGRAARHVVIAQGPGRWSDPARTATDVVAAVRLAAPVGRRARRAPGGWLAAAGWRPTARSRAAVDAVLDADGAAERAPAGQGPGRGAARRRAALGRVQPADQGPRPAAGAADRAADPGQQGSQRHRRAGLLGDRRGAGASGRGGGPAVALLGDLALLHDAPGLFSGPDEPRPDLCLIVVNNDGGGIFSHAGAGRVPWSVRAGLRHPARGRARRARRRRPGCRSGDSQRLRRELAVTCHGRPGRDQPRAGHQRLVEVRHASRPDQAALRQRLADSAAAPAAGRPCGSADPDPRVEQPRRTCRR